MNEEIEEKYRISMNKEIEKELSSNIDEFYKVLAECNEEYSKCKTNEDIRKVAKKLEEAELKIKSLYAKYTTHYIKLRLSPSVYYSFREIADIIFDIRREGDYEEFSDIDCQEDIVGEVMKLDLPLKRYSSILGYHRYLWSYYDIIGSRNPFSYNIDAKFRLVDKDKNAFGIKFREYDIEKLTELHRSYDFFGISIGDIFSVLISMFVKKHEHVISEHVKRNKGMVALFITNDILDKFYKFEHDCVSRFCLAHMNVISTINDDYFNNVHGEFVLDYIAELVELLLDEFEYLKNNPYEKNSKFKYINYSYLFSEIYDRFINSDHVIECMVNDKKNYDRLYKLLVNNTEYLDSDYNKFLERINDGKNNSDDNTDDGCDNTCDDNNNRDNNNRDVSDDNDDIELVKAKDVSFNGGNHNDDCKVESSKTSNKFITDKKYIES